MLPVLKKPYDAEAIVKITQDLKLGLPDATTSIDLDEALAKNWIEFWYQPKIDLRSNSSPARKPMPAPAIRSTACCCRSVHARRAEESTIKLSELRAGERA